jgi:dihydroorotate dehydrogenase (fumarate)
MNLTTNYLGMLLQNPIVASSSPLSSNVNSIRRLEDAGAAAVVMYSLFEEQIGFDSYYLDYHLTQGIDSYAESISYFPDMQSYNVGPQEYLNLIREAKEAVDIPGLTQVEAKRRLAQYGANEACASRAKPGNL